MQTDERGIYQKGCNHCLENADNGCLLADFLQLRHAELVADREGDEAERNVTDDAEALDVFGAGKAKTGYVKCAKHVRTNQNTCNQVSGHGGERCQLSQTREHQPRNQCYGKGKQDFHKISPRRIF